MGQGEQEPEEDGEPRPLQIVVDNEPDGVRLDHADGLCERRWTAVSLVERRAPVVRSRRDATAIRPASGRRLALDQLEQERLIRRFPLNASEEAAGQDATRFGRR
jgi:hypothetical protein